MPCVVVAGGGFAGLSAARELQRRRRQADDLEIVLVDRNNFTLFTPLLPEVASGGVAPRDVVQTFRELLPGARCELGEVIEIDAGSRRVRVRHPLTAEVRELPYDELILALGSTPSSHGVAGVAEHTLPLHSVDDAVRIRNAVIGAFEVAARTQDLIERDRLLRFVVVGGGFTGVESVGELSAFARSIARYYPKRAAQFVLVHDGGRLLSHLPPRFGKYAARSLSDRGVHLIFDRKVASVDDLGIKLDDGRRLES
ncbi:MAG TPA: FAD-dependent oxidoreductase, partial [Candidatus Tumulicola sp.]|nr:FAD-dependent oxidoreductase [Candidatus Tumulicola sp.]